MASTSDKVKNTIVVDKEHAQPLYRQISSDVRRKIKGRNLLPDKVLPPISYLVRQPLEEICRLLFSKLQDIMAGRVHPKPTGNPRTDRSPECCPCLFVSSSSAIDCNNQVMPFKEMFTPE